MTATFRIPGIIVRDHTFHVPLDYDAPSGPQISVFAREVVAVDKQNADLPWLVFLQGGPGGKSPRPTGTHGWIGRALQEYRVLLLDQRGTGRSTPVNRQSLARLASPQAQADYLMHFRADSIVRDAETIRERLLGPDQRWSILGQSFGGFCALTYLSFAPHGLNEAFITGGLAPLTRSADEVYRKTYQRVRTQNQRYFERYPQDQARAQEIVAYLIANDVRLPNGDRLTPRRFQTLGLALGMSDGFEQIHYLLDEAFIEGPNGPELSDTFLYGAMAELSFADRPLFAVLHEAIYCQGTAARHAAERVRAEYPEFEPSPNQPLLFTGEMIYPWLFEEDSTLQPFREAYELLSSYNDWPPLYDPAQLRENQVPVAAVIYADDMYVEREFSEETAQAIANCRYWLTNEYQHNGLRADGETILSRLIGMVRGEI